MHIFFLLPVYYGNQCFHLKNNNKKGVFFLFTCGIFSVWQLVHFSVKIMSIATNSQIIYIYMYIKLKLGTPKYICLKWVFLPHWHLDMILFHSNVNRSFMPVLGSLCLHATYYPANGILFIKQYFQIKIKSNLQRV